MVRRERPGKCFDAVGEVERHSSGLSDPLGDQLERADGAHERRHVNPAPTPTASPAARYPSSRKCGIAPKSKVP